MSDTVQRAIGRRLRDLRLRIGDRQEDLAQRIGWSRPRLSKHERGAAHLTIEEVLEIADALGRSPLAVLLDLLPEDRDDPMTTTMRCLQRTPGLAPLLAALETMPTLVPTLLQVVQQELQARQHRDAAHRVQAEPDEGDIDDGHLWDP